MKTPTINYNAFEKELLALVKYHIKIIRGKIASGQNNEDNATRLEAFDKIIDTINTHANNRITQDQKFAQEKINLLKHRKQADCPECNTTKKVLIKGHTTHPEFGWQLDIVKCTTCKTTFTNFMPNNWEDRLLFSENWLMMMQKVNEDGTTMLEMMKRDGVIEDSDKVVNQFKAFIAKQLEVEVTTEKYIIAIATSTKVLEKLRDELLSAKASMENWNGSIGIA